jgi:hypothetical protein
MSEKCQEETHALQQFDGFDGAILPLVAVAGLSTYYGRRTARQDNPKLRELTGLCLDIYRPIVLLDDDVKNGLNIFSLTSGDMPAPLSRILISTLSPRFFVAAERVGS